MCVYEQCRGVPFLFLERVKKRLKLFIKRYQINLFARISDEFELDTINKTLKMTKPDGTDEVYSITSTNVSDYAFMRTGEKTFDIEVVNL